VVNRNRAEPDEPQERQARRPVIRSRLRRLLGWMADWGGSQPRVEPLLVPGDGPSLDWPAHGDADDEDGFDRPDEPQAAKAPTRVSAGKPVKPGKRLSKDRQQAFAFDGDTPFALPPLTLLSEPKTLGRPAELSAENARRLEGVLKDFGVQGEIVNVRPGPVVTLYELEPAPGIKSSRVIGLADDIARSMSAVSARVAVVPGRNAIGIELPNPRRDKVVLREMLSQPAFEALRSASADLPRQDHRRRAGHCRSRPHAAFADRRHHRLRQVGGDQHHDPVAPLSPSPGGMPPHPDRSEDAGALGL
jgi:DNA segregation ATPase FtsK/SpoIIIE-like protein